MTTAGRILAEGDGIATEMPDVDVAESRPIEGFKVMAVIPARGGSVRIPRKNIVDVCGRPMIGWAIEAARGSRFIGQDRVYVSTEDAEIAGVARSFGARIIDRPAELATGEVWTEPVIQHAVLQVEESEGPMDYVVWMNACLPQIRSEDIDHAARIVSGRGLREVMSVDPSWTVNSAVRIIRRDALFQQRLSVAFAVLPLPYTDINTADDLDRVREEMDRHRSDGHQPTG